MSRKPLIAGNWKMNLNHFEAISLVQKLGFALPAKIVDSVDVVVLPPFTDIRSVQTLIDGESLRILYGAQDLSVHDKGAYTGEISGVFLHKLGCSYVVVGHSERRGYHAESSEVVNAKIQAALRHQLTPIVCVGEPLEVREQGKHQEFCVQQLKDTLHGLTHDQVGKCVIAYEPIWAIGTGKVASAADAEEICALIRKTVKELTNLDISAALRILYGGSVSKDNINELMQQTNIDGALVGGASLKGEDFATICSVASIYAVKS